MIYKFTVDKYVKCWIRKEVAVNADSIKEACIKVLQTDTSKGSVIIDKIKNEDAKKKLEAIKNDLV